MPLVPALMKLPNTNIEDDQLGVTIVVPAVIHRRLRILKTTMQIDNRDRLDSQSLLLFRHSVA